MSNNKSKVAPLSADIDHEMNPTLYSFAKAWCVSQVGKPAGIRWDALVSFINSWGAKQREAGRQEGRSEVAPANGTKSGFRNDPTVQGMADCMDMVRQELIEAGVIGADVAPMFIANAVLAKLAASAPAQEPVAEFGHDSIFILRKQANGERFPKGTKLYAGPVPCADNKAAS